MCLEALSIQAFPGGDLKLEISLDVSPENGDACLSNAKVSATPIPTMIALQESDMPFVVSCAFELCLTCLEGFLAVCINNNLDMFIACLQLCYDCNPWFAAYCNLYKKLQVFAIQSCSQSMNGVVESLHNRNSPLSQRCN